MKKRLNDAKGSWAEELASTLWTYKTSIRVPIGETLFSPAFGTEVVIPVEMGIKSYRVAYHDPAQNDAELLTNLDLLEEKENKLTCES